MKVINALILLGILTIIAAFDQDNNNDIDSNTKDEHIALGSLKHGSTYIDNGIINKVRNEPKSSPLLTLETDFDSFYLRITADKAGM